jgi:hypothetical protein
MRVRPIVRVGAAVAGIAVVWLAACSDLGSPGSGVFSITPLQLPLPGIVVGDTMRDSLGVAAPLRVIAFNANGDTVAATPTFVLFDATAHLVNGAYLVADDTGRMRIIGGIGNLQTLPETVTVTQSPDTLFATDSAHHVKTFSVLGGDTSLVTSAELTTRVAHEDGLTLSDVNAVIVKYSIVSAPPPKGAIPTVYLVNGAQESTRDTTVTGRASRAARLRVQQLTSLALDSAVIQATASYRGVTIGTVTFTVVFKHQ